MARKRKTSWKAPRKRSVPVDWNTLSPLQKFNRLFRTYKFVTGGGGEGGFKGVNGTINAVSAQLVMNILGVRVIPDRFRSREAENTDGIRFRV
jgi:hypothetical protein